MHTFTRRLGLAAFGCAILTLLITLAALGLHGSPGASASTTNVTIGEFWFCDVSYQGGSYCDTTISVGDTVTWENTGIANHTSTECGNPCTPSSVLSGPHLWDSPNIFPGIFFSRLFDTPGTFIYSCKIHPTTMVGRIIVLAPTPVPTPSPTPGPPAVGGEVRLLAAGAGNVPSADHGGGSGRWPVYLALVLAGLTACAAVASRVRR